MKHIFTICLLLLVCSGGYAQENPPVTDDTYYQRELNTPGIRKPDRKQVIKTLDNIRILSRWYAGADLYARADQSTLDNDYEYLLFPTSAYGFSFSGQLGWIFREQLAIEGGYARTAIHNNVRLNTTNKGGFKFANSGNALFLRTKVLIEFEKTGLRRPGLWLGAGGWAIPNSGGTREPKGYKIFRYDGYGQPVDTTYISSKTTLSDKWTYGLEASAEYAFRINEWADMAIFLRRQWGFGNAITTELTYSDNKKILGKGHIESNGTGWSFGVSLRFVSNIRRGAPRNSSDALRRGAPSEIILTP